MLGARQYLCLLCWWITEGSTGYLSTERTLSWCVCTVFMWKTVVLIRGWTVCESVCLALEADSSEHAVEERAQNVETLRLGMQPQFHASSTAQHWTKYLVILVRSVLIGP